ncbi:MAG: Ig-like domain-containing protein [Cytophagaceae bacterium]
MKPEKKIWLLGIVLLLISFNVNAQTNVIKGLTVVVEFLDAPFPHSLDSVAMMMNQPGFSGWGNTGSVRDFFYDQSDQKLLITSTVIKVSLPDSVHRYYHRSPARRDIEEIVAKINQQYPDGFTGLTINLEDSSLVHFNTISKAEKGAWAFGQQPGYLKIKNNGLLVNIKNGNNSTFGRHQNPSRSAVCHEMGHSIMKWADYYFTDNIGGNTNIGHYCVMGSGGDHFNPMPICAPLRYEAGWINTVEEIPNITQTYTIASNSRSQAYKYTNPNNPNEYFIIEALYKNGYYPPVDVEGFDIDQGLAVWYVDKERGRFQPHTLPDHPSIKLIQADGLDELGTFIPNPTHAQKNKLRGDLHDLFDNEYSSLTASSHPYFRWKDGSEPGLTITNISAPGPTMQFTVQARPNTIASQVTYHNGGTVSPRGLISHTSGVSKTFNIIPEIGYEVSTVFVNNVSMGSINSHTITTGGDHRIAAIFNPSDNVDPLPSPWQEVQIGNTRQAGVAGFRSGLFGLESNSYDIWGTADGLTFIYQPMIGDGEIVARVNSMNNPTDWAKAGIMMRESLTASSKHFMLVKTPSNNYAPQMRRETGQVSYHNPNNTEIKAEYNTYSWIKIVREGNVFSSYCSLNGLTNWVLLATETITMNSTVYVGLCAGTGSDNLATKATFGNVKVTTSNNAPFVSITSPLSNQTFTAPANITISANAFDNDGYVTKVEFFNGTTLLGTDTTAPYSFQWNNLPAGFYSINAKATDNLGATTTSHNTFFEVEAPVGDIAGPSCGDNNSVLSFELSASKRTNATGYNWYYNGSVQSIIANPQARYLVNVSTGNWFSAGQLCVGVNYNGSPWYATFCVPVAKCSSARLGDDDFEWEEDAVSSTSAYPNPFSSETTIPLLYGKTTSIEVYNALGILVHQANASGEYTFGSNLASGIYSVKLTSDNNSKTIKIIKQ